MVILYTVVVAVCSPMGALGYSTPEKDTNNTIWLGVCVVLVKGNKY